MLLCSPRCSEACYVDKSGLELRVCQPLSPEGLDESLVALHNLVLKENLRMEIQFPKAEYNPVTAQVYRTPRR